MEVGGRPRPKSSSKNRRGTVFAGFSKVYNKDKTNTERMGARTMNVTGKNGWALLLIFLGALIFLNFIGIGLGALIGLLFPLALIGLGIVGIKNQKSVIGWTLIVIGLIGLLSKLSGWIGLILAVILIGAGISMLKQRRVY